MQTSELGTTVAAPQVASVGSLIDQYYELRDQLREAQAVEKEIKGQMDVLEEELIALYDAQGVTLCRGRRASASITEQDIPVVNDWEAFWDYVFENRAAHLLQKRVGAGSWQELRDAGELVPGTEVFTKRGISVRKI